MPRIHPGLILLEWRCPPWKILGASVTSLNPEQPNQWPRRWGRGPGKGREPKELGKVGFGPLDGTKQREHVDSTNSKVRDTREGRTPKGVLAALHLPESSEAARTQSV